MPIRYLLDTNMASYVIKGSVPHVRENLRQVPMAEVGISAVTEGELRFGVARKPGASRLHVAVEEFLVRVRLCRGTSLPPTTTQFFAARWRIQALPWAAST